MTTLWFESALLASGWARGVRLSIAAGSIESVQTDVEPEPNDERHGVALPGLSNLHSHAFQRGMAGLAEGSRAGPVSFWGWRDVMYRFLERLEPEDVEAIAALAYLEMLESGFTRVGEFHYLHNDRDGSAYANPAENAERIAAASAEVGIKLTLLPVFYAYSNFGRAPPTPGQRRFTSDRPGFERIVEASQAAVKSSPGGVLGVAPHSLRAVGADDLGWLAAIRPEGPIHIHVAEQMREVESCLAWSGRRPVAWLFDQVPIDRRWCLVHATHVDADEIQRIADSGAVVGLCPITEANLGDGLFPAAPHAARAGAFGVGTDSNVLIDAAEELRLLEYGQRLSTQTRNVLAAGSWSTGRSLFEAALSGGALAIQGGAGLRAGAPADLFGLDLAHPSLLGREGDQILDGWLFASKKEAIDSVWVAGSKVVEHGRHLKREQVLSRYRQSLLRLLQ
jgi:formimidoylglutamate deiminase